MKEGEPILKELKMEVMEKSSCSCCVCQIPFIHAHHIDFNPDNNIFDNLAPLCPNHHTLAHTKGNMHLNLSPERIKSMRDTWYSHCENRRQNFNYSGDAKLKLKNFVMSFDFQKHQAPKKGWKKIFSSLDPSYKDLTVDEIIDHAFTTSNPDSIKARLESVKFMYSDFLQDKKISESFKEVCNAFGFDFDGKDVI